MSDQLDYLKNAYLSQKDLFSAVLDPFVVLTPKGDLVEFNDLFAQRFCDSVEREQIFSIAGPFFNFIAFSIDDKNLRIDDLFKGQQLRLDEVKADLVQKGNEGKKQNSAKLIISIFPFDDETTHECLGYMIMMRDVTQEAELQVQYRNTSALSLTDALTGIRNRAYLDQYLQSHFDSIRQSQKNSDEQRRSFAVIMSDIDHFKKINDTYGHQAGDLVIKKVAQVLQQKIRKTDIVCRYGGEEFFILLNGANTTHGIQVAEKLRVSIMEEEFIYDGKKIRVTVSFGVSEIFIEDQSPMDSVKRADAALYESKNRGRNRVTGAVLGPVLPRTA